MRVSRCYVESLELPRDDGWSVSCRPFSLVRERSALSPGRQGPVAVLTIPVARFTGIHRLGGSSKRRRDIARARELSAHQTTSPAGPRAALVSFAPSARAMGAPKGKRNNESPLVGVRMRLLPLRCYSRRVLPRLHPSPYWAGGWSIDHPRSIGEWCACPVLAACGRPTCPSWSSEFLACVEHTFSTNTGE